MSKCCGKPRPDTIREQDPCSPPATRCGCGGSFSPDGIFSWFGQMIERCIEYAENAHENGRPIVGIMCEFTPRELIMAAGGVPVCLCGGSAEMILPAEEDLPANLCPLIKSTYGYHKERANPFLEMASLIVAETTCDGKKKMYELMGESRPIHVLELPQKPDDLEAFRHWVCELRKLKEVLQDRFGTEVTDDRLRHAIGLMNEERQLRRQLAELMKAKRPPLTGRELLDLKSTISCIPCDFENYRQLLRELPNRQSPVADKDPVRVLLTGVPQVHGAERVIELIEDNGGLVVAMENCSGFKPLHQDVDEERDDPLTALAQHYFQLPCSVMTANDRRLDLLKHLADEYRADCIIDLIWQACITYDVESKRVKTFAENELRLPYLRIETDYSPSDSARIAVRIEALFETVKG